MATRERSRPTQVQRIATPQSEIVARPSPPVIDTAVETTVMANVDGMATPDRGISMFMEIRWPGDTIGGVWLQLCVDADSPAGEEPPSGGYAEIAREITFPDLIRLRDMISVTIERARGLGWPVDATDRVSVMDAERAMRDLSDYDRSRWSPRE